MVMLTQNVRDLMEIFKKTWASVEAPRKQNMELTGEEQQMAALVWVKTAQLNALTEGLVSVKSKLAGTCLESANSRCGAKGVAECISKSK